MLTYIITTDSNQANDRAGMYVGTLEEMKEHLAAQAHRYDWSFGEYSAWGLDVESLEPGEEVPALTTENMLQFASIIWDVPEKHLNLHEAEMTTQ